MKHNSIKKLLSLILGFVLIAALALTGCSGTPAGTTAPPETTEAPQAGGEVTVLGEGSKVFAFTVIDRDEVTTVFEIHTDAETVGEALVSLELIAGEESEYGLYVKSVLGQELDYGTDGMYWSFYVNGEYALTGVDQTPVAEGESYMFKAEAA